MHKNNARAQMMLDVTTCTRDYEVTDDVTEKNNTGLSSSEDIHQMKMTYVITEYATMRNGNNKGNDRSRNKSSSIFSQPY